jgi:hypothetical protein
MPFFYSSSLSGIIWIYQGGCHHVQKITAIECGFWSIVLPFERASALIFDKQKYLQQQEFPQVGERIEHKTGGDRQKRLAILTSCWIHDLKWPQNRAQTHPGWFISCKGATGPALHSWYDYFN